MLGEAALYESGAITRFGTIEDQNTVSDIDEDEHKRKFSLNLAILPVEWEGRKINFIDTPGYADFVSEGDLRSACGGPGDHRGRRCFRG